VIFAAILASPHVHVTYMYTLTLYIAIIKLLLLLYTMGVFAKILPFRHEFDEVMSEALTAPNEYNSPE
jgi:hypothetical protein